MVEHLPSRPALAVVIVTPSNFAVVRRTLRHLRRQTIAHRIELLLVAPSLKAIADREGPELDGFARVEIVPYGPIENVDHAAAEGVRRAEAPVVALVEDHAYPEPGWAAAMVRAHNGPWAAVGSAMCNANPRSLLSWTNLFIAYGPWMAPTAGGEVDTLPGHNIAYKRRLLAAYGPALGGKLERGGGLPNELRREGHRFYLEPAARLAHANPSLFSATADLRFSAGRLYGANRAAEANWTPARRLLYAAGAPLIPFVRLSRMRRNLSRMRREAMLTRRLWLSLLWGLVLDGAGQMVGYLSGPGRSRDKLAVFEMGRLQHLTSRDRELLWDG